MGFSLVRLIPGQILKKYKPPRWVLKLHRGTETGVSIREMHEKAYAKPKPKRPSKKDIIPGRPIRPADIATKEPASLIQDDDNAEIVDEIFDDTQQTNDEAGTSSSAGNLCGVCDSLFSPVFRHNYRWIYCSACSVPFHLECSTVKFKAGDYDSIDILSLPDYFCCTCRPRTTRAGRKRKL